MTDARHQTGDVSVTVGAPRPFRSGSGLGLLSIEMARRMVSLPRRALSILFPRQGPRPPVVLLPGYSARMNVDLRAPGRETLYVYPEIETVMGGSRIVPDAPQAVTLDRNGHATIEIVVTPQDMRTTGQAALRLVAVDPDTPNAIAGEAAGIMLTQQGTEALMRNMLVMLVAIGLAVQVWQTSVPWLAIMIVLALGMMMRNAPPIRNARFEPRRLLHTGRMLRAAALTALGAGIWAGAMGANIWSEDLSTICSTPITDDCGWEYAVFDNATSILASLGFAFLTLAAWAPAIRPAALVGRLALFAGLLPLLFYDLSLLPAQVSTDGRDALWLGTEAVVTGYPALGWTLSGLGIWLVMMRNGLGTARQRAIPLVVGVAGFCVMVFFSNLAFHLPGQEAVFLNEAVTRRLFGVVLIMTLMWALVRPALVPIARPRKVWRWTLGVGLWLGIAAVLISGTLAFVTVSDGWGTPNPGIVDHVLAMAALSVLAIGLCVAETLRWTRRGAPPADRAAADDAPAADAATPASGG